MLTGDEIEDSEQFVLTGVHLCAASATNVLTQQARSSVAQNFINRHISIRNAHGQALSHLRACGGNGLASQFPQLLNMRRSVLVEKGEGLTEVLQLILQILLKFQNAF